MADEELNYLSYLQVPQLLSLQRLRSEPPHPEELHFIVVHQALELWFKLLLHDLERIVAALDADDWAGTLVLLRRVNDVMATGLDQMRSLHDMPPWSLQQFRSYLGTASGLQSVQFRELELLSGLRDPAHLKALTAFCGGRLQPDLEARLAQRSLAEAHADAAARLGITGDAEAWADFYADPGEHGAFYVVCESLVDYDERWIRWRNEHVTLVERSLGARIRGTAGTAISYLQATTRYRYFPQLWELRNALSVRGGGELVDRR
ncbi:MAG: tryptophan 2,3-dioxygenase [Euzebyales bacterium]|nr:tryptophan 2,3-dioxygenase [Euzebyales bacterium]